MIFTFPPIFLMTLHDGALGLLLVSLSAWDVVTRECPRWLFLAWAGVLLAGWAAGAWPGSWLGAGLGWGAARWCRWPGGDQRAGMLIGFLVGPLAWLGGLAVTLAALLLVPVRWARWLNRWPMIPLVSAAVGGLYWSLHWYEGGFHGSQ